MSQASVARLEAEQDVALRVVRAVLASVGLRLVVVGADVVERPEDAARDTGGRRLPAHLPVTASSVLPVATWIRRYRRGGPLRRGPGPFWLFEREPPPARTHALAEPSGIAEDVPVDLSFVRAVLLDMDGTLVGSDAAVERAWRAWSREYGVAEADALATAHGHPAESTARRLLPGLDDDAVLAAAQRQHDLQYDDLADVHALPGAHELLDVLAHRQLPWAVVTSADVRLARARLGAAGIAVRVLVTVEDVAAGKPDAEGYLLAARRLGVPPGQCLVVEDSEPGIAAGHAAGMTVAALRGLPAEVPLRDLGELARLLAT